MDEPKVSLIVPVYNIAPYLERCLSSIRDQTCGGFEALLVDDGSSDRAVVEAHRLRCPTDVA